MLRLPQVLIISVVDNDHHIMVHEKKIFSANLMRKWASFRLISHSRRE